MPRSERLFDLLDVLRRHRFPVSGQALADELGISLRTLYRDIASLQSMGADIEGEPGIGYVLRPGFLLPPLSFPAEELEALVLGARWIAEHADITLRRHAESALARIETAVPPAMRQAMAATPLIIGPSAAPKSPEIDEAVLLEAIRTECKLAIAYRDANYDKTERVIWPFAYSFFDEVRLLIGWCELRKDFRSFRIDRILRVDVTETPYPRRREVLLAEWRKQQNISPYK